MLEAGERVAVGVEEVDAAELAGGNPVKLLALERLGGAGLDLAPVESQDELGGAKVTDLFVEMGADRDLHADFFHDLAFDAGAEIFAFFAFAAWELPPTCEGFAFGSGLDEVATVLINAGHADLDLARVLPFGFGLGFGAGGVDPLYYLGGEELGQASLHAAVGAEVGSEVHHGGIPVAARAGLPDESVCDLGDGASWPEAPDEAGDIRVYGGEAGVGGERDDGGGGVVADAWEQTKEVSLKRNLAVELVTDHFSGFEEVFATLVVSQALPVGVDGVPAGSCQ